MQVKAQTTEILFLPRRNKLKYSTVDIVALINHLKSSGSVGTTCFNMLKLLILSIQCIWVFHVVFTINHDCFPKQD